VCAWVRRAARGGPPLRTARVGGTTLVVDGAPVGRELYTLSAS
jgi:hypothetical protein